MGESADLSYWEDFPVGSETEHGTVEVSEADILDGLVRSLATA